jgi:hypothetical protein
MIFCVRRAPGVIYEVASCRHFIDVFTLSVIEAADDDMIKTCMVFLGTKENIWEGMLWP